VKQGNMEAFLDVAMNQAQQHQDLGPGRIQVSKGKAGLKRSLATLFLKTNTVPNRLGCWLTGLWNLPE